MPGTGRGREGRGERFGSPLPLAGMLLVCHTGYTICYYPRAVSQMVSDVDRKLLFCSKGSSLLHPPPSVSAGSTGPQTQRAGRKGECPGLEGQGGVVWVPNCTHPMWEGGCYSTRAVGRRGMEGTSDSSLLSWSF